MDKKIKKAKREVEREGINQFIIECMFSKYFEEQRHSEIVSKKEEVRV
ncbi:MAG: hypothetical protein KKD29_01105 [Candidatus Omnitrophica bacterium]|nr:hypothetical protein [Candidatus Omnitrophota bacterium]